MTLLEVRWKQATDSTTLAAENRRLQARITDLELALESKTNKTAESYRARNQAQGAAATYLQQFLRSY